MSTKATVQGVSVRLLQAWLVPRWIRMSPAFNKRLALIHQRIDFAGEHDGVVDGIGFVKAGVTGIAAIGGMATAGTIVGPGQLGGERRQTHAVGGIFDDAQHAAVFRRRQSKAAVDGVGIAAIIRRRARRLPQLRDDDAAGAALEHVRRRAVHDEDGFTRGIVPGDNAADRLGHQRHPLSLLSLLISSNLPSSFAAASAKLASTRRPLGAVLSMIFSCL